MKFKKIFIFFFLLIISLFFTSFTNVFAKQIQTSDELKIEDCIIREENEIGLQFKANIGSFDKSNVKRYGILLAYGKASLSNEFVKGSIINEKKVLSGEVKNSINNTYTVTLIKIPNTEYIKDVTARCYVVTDNDIVYGNNVYNISMAKLALEKRVNNNESTLSKEIVDYIDTNYVNVYKNNQGYLSISTDLYERNYKILYKEFIKDFNEFFDQEIESFTSLEFKDFMRSNHPKDLSNSNLYLFFNDENLKPKWSFILEYFRDYKGNDIVNNQAKALLSDGTCGNEKLQYGEDIIYSIYNFFNASDEIGHYTSISFKDLNLYNEATKNSRIYFNLDNVTLKKIGTLLVLPSVPTLKDGYKWNSFKVNDNSYKAEQNYKLKEENISFIPTFDLIDYSIKYMEGINEIKTTNPVNYNVETEDIILNDYKKEGYFFNGWYNNPNFDGEKIDVIKKGSFGNLTLYAKFTEISDNVSNTNNYLINFFNNLGVIEKNINLPLKYDKENTTITWKSLSPNIISNNGKLKRDYKESNVTLEAIIKYDNNEFKFTYDLKVKGYKSLDNIASSYIYTNYHKVTPLFFDTLDIINCAFVVGNADGSLSGYNFFNNVNKYIIDKAHEQGIYVIASIAPGSKWSVIANPKNGLVDTFSSNVVKMINEYGFDGVDIDWEYPGSGEYEWFTNLSKSIYKKVKLNNKNHLVTAAIAGGRWQPNYYDLKNSKNYLDYINLMCYGMTNNDGQYHNALYPHNNFNDSTNKVGKTLVSCSIDESVKYYKEKFNINPDKLIAGFSFYGIVQTRELTNGSYTKWKFDYNASYTEILNNYLKDSNYKEVYDEKAKVPYIISKDGLTFISYDNAKSVIDKCNYSKQKGLAGLMYWQNGLDLTDTLLNALKTGLSK